MLDLNPLNVSMILSDGGGAAAAAAPKRSAGLLYAYDLEEASGTRYSFDGHGPDLDTVVGAPGNTTGVIGQGFLGDGSSSVEANDVSINTTLDGLANFTISFWYKDHGGAGSVILNFNYLNPYISWYGSAGAYSTLKINVHGDNRYSIVVHNNAIEQVQCPWQDGNWHHGLYTFDGAQISTARLKGYFDGVDMDGLVSGRAATTNCPVSELDANLGSVNQEMQIGSYFTPGYEAEGSIDLVAMWNYTMTQEEVEYEYNSGAGRAFE
jgi:hypothetical protein